MFKKLIVLIGLIIILGGLLSLPNFNKGKQNIVDEKEKYWFVLHRKSNVEYLYKGIPEDKNKSTLLRTFIVKTGIPGERPTPLPKILGKDYWLITKKASSADNPETAPYFLTLNIPVPTGEPFGPKPYLECNGPSGERGKQCNWQLPGEFGLHGINGDESRLSTDNPGSSGCIRHSDADITYLYNILKPELDEIRYYIEDI